MGNCGSEPLENDLARVSRGDLNLHMVAPADWDVVVHHGSTVRQLLHKAPIYLLLIARTGRQVLLRCQ